MPEIWWQGERNIRGNNCASARLVEPKGNCALAELDAGICTCGNNKWSEWHNKAAEKTLNYVFATFDYGKHVKESPRKLHECMMSDRWDQRKQKKGHSWARQKKWQCSKKSGTMHKAHRLILGQHAIAQTKNQVGYQEELGGDKIQRRPN